MTGESRLLMPKRQMLSDDVYDAIKESIVTGRLPAGSKINLEELRRETGVSNTPIRQALSRLEAEGFVVKEAYRGFAVSEPPDGRRLEEIFEVRLLLEPASAGLAALRAEDADIELLRALAARARADPEGSAALDGEFHRAVAHASKNSVLSDEIERVRERRITYNLIYGISDNAETTWHEHDEILDALVAGDSAASELAMRRHLERSRERHRQLRQQP